MDAEIAKAIELVEQFFQDPVQRQIYWENERRRLDRLSNERYYWQQGFEEGLKEAREERAERMLVKALRKHSVADVAHFLDLPMDYVQTIAAKNGITTM